MFKLEGSLEMYSLAIYSAYCRHQTILANTPILVV